MYVCMYVCMYVSMSVTMYVCIRICIYVCVYVCMYICLYITVYATICLCIYVHTCMYVRMYVCMYVSNYVCMWGSSVKYLPVVSPWNSLVAKSWQLWPSIVRSSPGLGVRTLVLVLCPEASIIHSTRWQLVIHRKVEGEGEKVVWL